MKRPASLLFAAPLLLAAMVASAGDEVTVSARDQQAVTVAIYNKNLALVKDRRKVTLPTGIHTLAFREVSARIKPETALVHGGEFRVLEQNFEYDLLTPQSLLQKYVGREVTMITRHPTTGEEQSRQVKVLAAGKGVVLQSGDRIETEVSGRLVYADVPPTLRDRPTTIGENQKKQVALLQAEGVHCRKEFLLSGQEYYFSTPAGEIGKKMKIGAQVELVNDKGTGLGLPIPAGTVRVYKKDGGGFLQFVGEDKVDHTPEKEAIRLHLGDAFDVTADKRQTDFKKIAGSGRYNYQFESEYEVVLKNAKKEQVVVKVQEPVPGDWEMVKESQAHVKEAAHTAAWNVAVPPMASTTLTYRVQVKY